MIGGGPRNGRDCLRNTVVEHKWGVVFILGKFKKPNVPFFFLGTIDSLSNQIYTGQSHRSDVLFLQKLTREVNVVSNV